MFVYWNITPLGQAGGPLASSSLRFFRNSRRGVFPTGFMLSSLAVNTVERLGTDDDDDDDDVVGGAMIAEDAVAEDAAPGAIIDVLVQ